MFDGYVGAMLQLLRFAVVCGLRIAFAVTKVVFRLLSKWVIPYTWKVLKWVMSKLWHLGKTYLPAAYKYCSAKARNYFATVKANNSLMPLPERENGGYRLP